MTGSSKSTSEQKQIRNFLQHHISQTIQYDM